MSTLINQFKNKFINIIIIYYENNNIWRKWYAWSVRI